MDQVVTREIDVIDPRDPEKKRVLFRVQATFLGLPKGVILNGFEVQFQVAQET